MHGYGREAAMLFCTKIVKGLNNVKFLNIYYISIIEKTNINYIIMIYLIFQ